MKLTLWTKSTRIHGTDEAPQPFAFVSAVRRRGVGDSRVFQTFERDGAAHAARTGADRGTWVEGVAAAHSKTNAIAELLRNET